jgi:hypothetical protein
VQLQGCSFCTATWPVRRPAVPLDHPQAHPSCFGLSMSVIRRNKPRKSLPFRSISPCSCNPGVVLKIGPSSCQILREDAKAFELLATDAVDLSNYGFVKPSERSSAVNSPSSENSFGSSAELVAPNVAQENRKPSRKNQTNGERTCASCGATKTPYWRDAWDGDIALCNACGLRYAKFKKRCSLCHYVPRKEDKNNRCCSQCKGSWL